jgi:hypothetical protein
MVGRDLEGSGHGLVEVLPRNFLLGLRKTTKISVRIAGVPAEIRTDYLPNTKLEPQRYASPFDLRL